MSRLSSFLKIGTMFPFFQSSRNISHINQFLNILKRGSIIASPEIFNMQILIISWPGALLGSRLQMILLISSSVSLLSAKYWSIIGSVDEAKTLLFSITEYCFAKRELKISPFLLKSVTNLSSRIISEMQRILFAI